MYHNVGYEPEDRGTISPEDLRSQWDWLRRQGYRNVGMDQIGRELAEGKLEPARRFAITFDDGRSGVYEHALPLLQELGLSATAYLVPSFLGETRWFSYRRTPASWITEDESRSSGGIRLTYLSRQDTRRWTMAGQSIGSHSLTHQHLACLGDGELIREVIDSACELENELGLTGGARHFAYPYGEYNRMVERVVGARHVTAVTVEQGPVTPNSRALALPRVDPGRNLNQMILRFARLGLL